MGKPEGEAGPNRVQVGHGRLALRRAARRRAVQLGGVPRFQDPLNPTFCPEGLGGPGGCGLQAGPSLYS